MTAFLVPLNSLTLAFSTPLINGVNYPSITFTVMAIVSIYMLLVFSITSLTIFAAQFKGLDWLRKPDVKFNPFATALERFKNPDWWQLVLLSILTMILSFLWGIIFIIPGIIKSLAYSQAFFIYKDINDRGDAKKYAISDYLTMSRQLMNGNKLEFFVLMLSFLGWFVLSLFTLGIGQLWLSPYVNLTLANYYEQLKEKNPKALDLESTKQSENPGNPALKRRLFIGGISVVVIVAGLTLAIVNTNNYSSHTTEQKEHKDANSAYLTKKTKSYYKEMLGVAPDSISVNKLGADASPDQLRYGISAHFSKKDIQKTYGLKGNKNLEDGQLRFQAYFDGQLNPNNTEEMDNYRDTIFDSVCETLNVKGKAVDLLLSNPELAEYFLTDPNNTSLGITRASGYVENGKSAYYNAEQFVKTHRIKDWNLQNVIDWVDKMPENSNYSIVAIYEFDQPLDDAASLQFLNDNLNTEKIKSDFSAVLRFPDNQYKSYDFHDGQWSAEH